MRAHAGDGDVELLAAARRADPEAIAALLEKYQRRVFGFGLRMCGDPEDAKDVVQETLLAAARTVGNFRGASSVSTWLYTIARSFCMKKRRRSKFAPPAEAPLGEAAHLPAATPAPDDALAAEETRTALRAALTRLDPVAREVLILRDMEGLTAAEVAEVTETSVAAVKSRLHRARLAVREDLSRALAEQLPAPSPGCPDILAAYSKKLEGEIDDAVCAELEAHMRGCVPCERACASLKRSLTICRTSGAEPVPAEVQAALRTGLRDAVARAG